MTIDIIIPTLKNEHAWNCLESLRYIPFGYRLHLMTKEKSWAEAINAGIKESENDVIIMDDDIEILPDTFKNFEDHWHMADIFGFKLLFPNGTIQHAGGHVTPDFVGHFGKDEAANSPAYSRPMEVCHVTASLMYVKSHVFKKLKGMETGWKGVQFEDVDFNMRAIKAGFKIVYLPFAAIHHETKTKKKSHDYSDKATINLSEVQKKYCSDKKFMESLNKYPKVIV